MTYTGAAGAGAAGSVSLFTVTGMVLIEKIIARCTTLLTESGATATIALGVTGNTGLFIAATDAVNIDANELWVDTAPDTGGIQIPALMKDVAIVADIINTIAAADVTAGVIEYVVLWRPLSSNGLLVPA